ncbi:MAG: transporter substrate-binding domain-containing protein [Microcoleus sp. PH2017_10_PVI_O_A]|uniref:transporter substrate-binding domain-containing protein n=1 Tax=unclassified Microcoleus TaxID=2642155 RepID=UPI001DAE28B0|nr:MULTISPECIES: transporter substrate-binding domain-containing protein [unclassified Microcoleus]MCC3409362.1 transporter substrate-binding domain-containing protein [Microcoleus sp. PH2017_10_PVI_O_A]MCC3463603.1 transporter substrate-binding domain-containing protein [Microcoleus sp. PH2017_11_PCY_U_A]MCC3481948.1 transporter substrate-binding domain-containing protein [Microcoleus sp. PH2017_12_PCY_D_A]MCC3562924.1 transporter substrate-binding domain-containing protein [Microcoleus sp. PH
MGDNVKTHSAEGFCGTFGKELEKELVRNFKFIKVQYLHINNEGLGQTYPRYHGLKEGWVHIECGPNSAESANIVEGQGIQFSNFFYKTGVKLLLKQSLATALNLRNKELSNIKVGAVVGTTTLNVLPGIFPNNIHPYRNRDAALKALERSEIEAFASDSLIVKNLLENGVNKYQQENKKAYKYSGYTIYPTDSSYLTLDPTEEYVMAVKKDTIFSKELLKTINKTLKTPEICQAQAKLKKDEGVEVIPCKPSLINKIKERIFLILLGVLIEILGAFIVILATSRLKNSHQRSSALKLGIIVCVFGVIILISTILGL